MIGPNNGAVINVLSYIPTQYWDGIRDGTNTVDLSTYINNAIIDAASTVVITNAMAVVEVPYGEYLFTGINLKPYVKFVGKGGILKLADNVAIDAGVSYYPLSNVASIGNSWVEGIILNGNKANNTLFTVCDGLTLEGDNCRAINNIIINPPDAGITIGQMTNTLVTGNYITGSTDTAIYANDSTGATSKNNIISNNVIESCYQGIAVKRYLAEVLVTNNTMRDVGVGISVEDFGSGVNPDRVIVSQNDIIYVGYNYAAAGKVAISLQAATNCICIGNLINDVEYQGIIVSGLHNSNVSHNTIYCVNTASATNNIGIQIAARTGHSVTNTIISHNLIQASQSYGIYCLNNASGTCTGNKIHDNYVISAVSNAMRIDNQFTSCEFYNNTLDGTTFDLNYNIAGGTLADNFIHDNKLVNGNLNGDLGSGTGSYHAFVHYNKYTNGTAAPTIGTWKAGDRCINRGYTADANNMIIDHWKCTANGTPGTWIPVYISTVSPAT